MLTAYEIADPTQWKALKDVQGNSGGLYPDLLERLLSGEDSSAIEAQIDNNAFTQGELSEVSPLIVETISQYLIRNDEWTHLKSALKILSEAIVIAGAHLENRRKVELSTQILKSAMRCRDLFREQFISKSTATDIRFLAFEILVYLREEFVDIVMLQTIKELRGNPAFSELFEGYFCFDPSIQRKPVLRA